MGAGQGARLLPTGNVHAPQGGSLVVAQLVMSDSEHKRCSISTTTLQTEVLIALLLNFQASTCCRVRDKLVSDRHIRCILAPVLFQ